MPLLVKVTKTPSFLLYNHKTESVEELDLMLEEPLTAEDGYADLNNKNESEQLRELLSYRANALITQINKL